MALDIQSLAGIARDTGSLVSRINELRRSGQDEKTDLIEREALQLVNALEQILTESENAGEAPGEELKRTLEAQEKALREHLESSELDLNERMAVLGQLADLNFKLANIIIGRTLTWERLIGAQELQQYREALRQAADEVRRRKKLQAITRSIFGIFSISLGITSKIAAL